MAFLDSERARQIIDSPQKIEVLYQGSPVWIENVTDNNTANVTYIETHDKVEVPVYRLVENNPVKS